MRLVNLTAHNITVLHPDGNAPFDFLPDATRPVPRLEVRQEPAGTLAGLPVVRSVPGPVLNAPEPEEGVVFITSTLVAQALKRADMVSPDTGPTAVRENGQVTAIRRFQRFDLD